MGNVDLSPIYARSVADRSGMRSVVVERMGLVGVRAVKPSGDDVTSQQQHRARTPPNWISAHHMPRLSNDRR
jgi:hypothetical protein